ncbi:MAG: A/G-specific adenine glycosylase [Theionarchaea archaeon]|nr:A/G-specific adenine glycosylase [Theionarchaea archaeon]
MNSNQSDRDPSGQKNVLGTEFSRFSRELTSFEIHQFQDLIYDFYNRRGRSFPWRETTNPYHILVSEFMLQQTQTQRVIKKYEQFLIKFPDFPSLAQAPLRDILSVWRGLGYNRRALSLKKTAQLVMSDHGILPDDPALLTAFPGIGKATAGAIFVYAFNKPAIFLETNIRTVFLHFFFSGEYNITDAKILPLVDHTLDRKNPRTWYYALTDYGVWLKKKCKNPGKRSAHYQVQSPFKGSDRELRGTILAALLSEGEMPVEDLMRILPFAKEKIETILTRLQKEGFITIEEKSGRIYVRIVS